MVMCETPILLAMASRVHEGSAMLTTTDLRALTPLIWEHVNPYGRFDLDMATRLPLNLSLWRLVTRMLGLPLHGGLLV